MVLKVQPIPNLTSILHLSIKWKGIHQHSSLPYTHTHTHTQRNNNYYRNMKVVTLWSKYFSNFTLPSDTQSIQLCGLLCNILATLITPSSIAPPFIFCAQLPNNAYTTHTRNTTKHNHSNLFDSLMLLHYTPPSSHYHRDFYVIFSIPRKSGLEALD